MGRQDRRGQGGGRVPTKRWKAEANRESKSRHASAWLIELVELVAWLIAWSLTRLSFPHPHPLRSFIAPFVSLDARTTDDRRPTTNDLYVASYSY